MGFISELNKTSRGAEIIKAIRMNRSRPMGRSMVVEAIVNECFAADTVAKKVELIKEYQPLLKRWVTKDTQRRLINCDYYLKGVESGFYKDEVPVVKFSETDYAF